MSHEGSTPTSTPESIADALSCASDQNRSTPSASRRSIVFTIELSCLLCAREAGVLQSPIWPACAGSFLRPGVPAVHPTDWHHLRCETCGGSVLPSEVTRMVVHSEPPIDWLADRPRRGRPPKRLGPQRKSGEPAA
jgi:hypothetical protein